jgi:hypothetical protein
MSIQKTKLIFVYFFGILFIFSIIYAAINSFLDWKYLKDEYSYTISSTISGGTTGITGSNNKYTFLLHDVWYQAFTKLPLRRDGTKYFIKFYPKNPNRNKATMMVADSMDIKNLPPDGYKELPHQ